MSLYGFPEEAARKLFLGTIGTQTDEQIRMLEEQFAGNSFRVPFTPEFRIGLGKYIDRKLPYHIVLSE